MVLLMHNAVGSFRYSQKEALYYSEQGLSAGDYCFTVKGQSWYSSDNDKVYYFTLTQALPAGGQIVLNATASQSLEGKTVTTYSGATSTTEIESAELSATEIANAVSLGMTNGTDGMNAFSRTAYGSNNYSTSIARVFINSNGGVDEWWEPVGVYDRPPADYGFAGLLYGMDADFISAVGVTNVPCIKGISWDEPGTGSTYTVQDKFFVPSKPELGGPEGSDGNVFALYSDAEDADRIKYDLTDMSTTRLWFTRTPSTNAFNFAHVTRTGSFASDVASGSGYVAAACVIY